MAATLSLRRSALMLLPQSCVASLTSPPQDRASARSTSSDTSRGIGGSAMASAAETCAAVSPKTSPGVDAAHRASRSWATLSQISCFSGSGRQ